MISEIKKEIDSLKITRKTLLDFGLLFFFFFNILSLILYFKQKCYWFSFSILGALFLLLGIFSPNFLRNFYRIWMTLAFIISWFLTRIMTILTFYLIFTPTALILRIFRKDLLEQKTDKSAKTYWKDFEKNTDKLRYKSQF